MDEEFVFCGTNIFKQFSDWLSGYDGLMSAVELIVEGIFLLLVLKEFKMTKQIFEWTRKDRREEKTKRELCYFAWVVVNDYIMKLSEFVGKQDEASISSMTSNDYIDDYCKIVSEKCFLPISFCKQIMGMTLFNAYRQSLTPEEKMFDVKKFYAIFAQSANNFLSGAVAPIISKLSKHFNSVEEIDEIFEKLINIKL
ncbi:MAG: hypothetical protein IJT14_03030 [Rickettsiales bacterium]|nr:hypothetical protein [Rickettsiales bacterium]